MSPPPTFIDGTEITGATIDGQEVQEITVDGQTVFVAGGIPDGLVDNFELDPDGPYQSGQTLAEYYSGDLSLFQIVSSSVFGSSRAMEYSGNNGTIFSYVGDGLPNYFPKGETATVRLREDDTDGIFPFVNIGATPSDDGVQVQIFGGSANLFRIENANNGSILADASVSIGSEVHEIEIQRHDGSGSQPNDEIVAELYELDSNFDRVTPAKATLSANVSRIASQSGIAFGAASFGPQMVFADDFIAGQPLP